MNISDVVFEMELAGVDEAYIADIVQLYDGKVISEDLIDQELTKRGYPKLFNIDYDAYDEYDSWDDHAYSSKEKIQHKHKYED